MMTRNLVRRWIIALALSLIPATVILFLTATANNEASRMRPLEILSQLQASYRQAAEQVDFPVLLPTKVPGLGTDFWLTDFRLANSYVPEDGPIPEELRNPQYEFSIDVEEGCGGSGACSRGSIGGEVITENTQAIEEIHFYIDDYLNNPNGLPMSSEPMGAVELMGGIEGTFVPWVATAQCTESRVYWEQPSISGEERYRYYVGIECGDRADVVELANNVIANTEGL